MTDSLTEPVLSGASPDCSASSVSMSSRRSSTSSSMDSTKDLLDATDVFRPILFLCGVEDSRKLAVLTGFGVEHSTPFKGSLKELFTWRFP
uniref:Uncharacterized protein n=1 Tax=Anguilla anguilla TaxID=7936 RepID=A0A0E9W968_ANGAN